MESGSVSMVLNTRLVALVLFSVLSVNTIAQDGEAQYNARCATCHENPDPETSTQ
jgi:cytochrome c553